MSAKKIDWDSMSQDWRCGLKSVLQLSTEYGVSRAAIIKHWAKERVERDLSAKIRAEAEAKVTRDAVTCKVTSDTKATERQIVDSNAEMMASVIRSHHRSLGRMDSIIKLLFDRLEAELSGTELFSQLGELLASPDENGVDKLNDLYRKVIALPSHTDTAKKLAETLKVKIELERKVFKIEETPAIPPSQSCISVEFVNPPSREDGD